MRKLMVLASMAFVLLLAGGALAGMPCPGCETFATGDFTIQAMPNTVEVCPGVYRVDIILNNNTGAPLTDVKIQGGLAAWVDFVPYNSGNVNCTSDQNLVEFKALPNGPKNKTKDNAPNNKNIIMQYTQGLPTGPTTIQVVVSGDPGEFECPDSPNVIGSWSASAQYYDEGMGENVPVEAQALDQEDNLLWETCPFEPSESTCDPEDETPEVFVCDFQTNG